MNPATTEYDTAGLTLERAYRLGHMFVWWRHLLEWRANSGHVMWGESCSCAELYVTPWR